MSDIDEGDAQLVVHVLELDLHLLAHLEIQRAERLVQKQDLGLVDKRAGDGDSLLLSAGERADASLLKALEIDQVQYSSHLALDHILGRLLLLKAEGDVIVNIHMGKQSVSLEYRIDRALIGRQVLDRFPVKKDLALSRHRKAGNHAEGCRLSASRRTQKCYKFPSLHFQVKVIDSRISVFVDLRDALEFNNVCVVFHSLVLHKYCLCN